MSLISRHSHKTIAEEVELSDMWQEFPVRLTAQKSRQEVTLSFAGARLWLDKDLIETPNGVAIEPVVEIKDSDGNWHALSKVSFGITDVDINSELATLNRISFPVRTTKNKVFVAVRIRASHPVICRSVRWHCYYPK